ncbi:uncharacterized protein LOC125842849 [Solanum stenotomum]|uniref:uncharacterized protein LOC125842849 n=1 Tax=Solanum stenotomum TaxID=172797 RepID=UPI0020D155B0|nr:uncharacterized protein LOC125842849 [Solanum stenotomum]
MTNSTEKSFGFWDGTGGNLLPQDKVRSIQAKLLAAQSRQKKYTDDKVRALAFQTGEKVLLKVSPMKGVIKFGKNGKLSPRYIGPFEILDCVGPVAYRLTLPRSLYGVHPVFHPTPLPTLKRSEGALFLHYFSSLFLSKFRVSIVVLLIHIPVRISKAHPSHDKFINKKIDMFEEMSLVCGNDRARGDCAKSFEDIGLDCSSEKGNEDEIEGPSKENGVQDVSETSQVKSSRKRNRPSDVQDVVGDISTKLGEVAAAISKIADSRLDVTRLYEEVMAIEGYGEEFLGDAFDYLVQSDTLAKGFMAKNQNLRKVWLERFKRQHK